MRFKTIYINKETKERVNKYTLYDDTRPNFETEEEWQEWFEDNYEEKEICIESPYERTRRAVYATGNKWAIENFNATH